MPIRILVAGAVAAAAIPLALLADGGAAQSSSGRTLTYDVTLTSQKFISGGRIALLKTSYADTTGKHVGTDAETCPVYATKVLTLQCTITARLPGGQIVAVGTLHPQRLPYTVAVVGGTGVYDGTRGTLTSAAGPNKRTERVTIALRD